MRVVESGESCAGFGCQWCLLMAVEICLRIWLRAGGWLRVVETSERLTGAIGNRDPSRRTPHIVIKDTASVAKRKRVFRLTSVNPQECPGDKYPRTTPLSGTCGVPRTPGHKAM